MKQVAITFDDGPWADTTPIVLKTLQKYNVPATFMIWGEHALKNPELLKKEAQNSLFCFGNHTLHHVHLPELTAAEANKEITENDHVIENIIGRKPEYIRPPYGEFTPGQIDDKRPFIVWTLDTKSWDHHSTEKVLENIEKAKDGDIILMHDFQPADASALDDAIQILFRNGFKIISIADLVGKDQIKNAKVIYGRDHITYDN